MNYNSAATYLCQIDEIDSFQKKVHWYVTPYYNCNNKLKGLKIEHLRMHHAVT